MAFYEDISTCTLGTTSITTVKSISVSETRPLTPESGDADSQASALIEGAAAITGTIVLADVSQARALRGQSGTLSFVNKGASGESDKTVTIVNCHVGDISETSRHAASAGAIVSFAAHSSDGSTSPWSES